MYIENDISKHPMISNFAFQPPAFNNLAEAARKAEEHIMCDPCAALFAALQHRAFRGEL
jgi:hypothetical protein